MSSLSSLAEYIADIIGASSKEIQKKITALTFAQYMHLSVAVKKQDRDTILSILGSINESDNAYRRPATPAKPVKPTNSTSSGTPSAQASQIKTGDDVAFTDENGNEISGKIARTSNTTVTVRNQQGRTQDIDRKEFDRLKQLAGIEETTVAGAVAIAAKPLSTQRRIPGKKKK